MKLKSILKGIGIATLAFALGTQAWSQPVTVTVRSQTITLTSAQIKNLNGTRIQIVAAPGAHNMIVPINAVFQYKFVTAPYTITNSNDSLSVAWGLNDPAFFATQVNLLDQPQNTVTVGMDAGAWQSVVGIPPAPVNDGQVAFENQPLTVTASFDPTGGDGTLVVIVTYEIVSLN